MLTLQAKEKEIENLTTDKEFVRGTVGAICQVNFDEFWQEYEKWVVFKRNGCEPIKVMVDSLTNGIEIPYTILAESGEFQVGVFGVTETETLPTLYSDYIKIRYGTDTNATTPPKYTPSEIEQLRLSKQDKLTAGDNITIDENNVISASGGGATDYEELDNKPKINGVELFGDKTTQELGINLPNMSKYYTKAEIDDIVESLPVGSGDNWELINKITTTEETKLIEFTTDLNGNLFELKRIAFSGVLKGTETNATNGTLYVGLSSGSHELDVSGILRKSDALVGGHAEVVGAYAGDLRGLNLIIGGTSANKTISEAGGIANSNVLSYIRFYSAGSNAIGAGTTIYIYGVRK